MTSAIGQLSLLLRYSLIMSTVGSCTPRADSFSPSDVAVAPLDKPRPVKQRPIQQHTSASTQRNPTSKLEPANESSISIAEATITEVTIAGATITLHPSSCRIDIQWNHQVFRESMEAVGTCEISRKSDGEIQIFQTKLGPTIIVGSSSKPDKEGWCDVLLHGILLSKSGPRISMDPQSPKLCGVHDLDDVAFALLVDETMPMKPVQ